MKSVEAIKILHGCDLEDRILFRSRELGALFDEHGDTLRSTIKRLTADGILERVAHDAYLYLLSHPNGCDLLGHIAAFLRPGGATYESLESAASQWGFISQIPLGRISCVTTIMVMPPLARFFMTPSTSRTSSGSRALVASSNSITCGSMASARAMATRCCWPPDSSAGL